MTNETDLIRRLQMDCNAIEAGWSLSNPHDRFALRDRLRAVMTSLEAARIRIAELEGAIDPEDIANQVVEALNAQASREGDQS